MSKVVNIQYNLFRKRDDSWGVRVESSNGTFVTNDYRTPELAMNAAISHCRVHQYFINE